MELLIFHFIFILFLFSFSFPLYTHVQTYTQIHITYHMQLSEAKDKLASLTHSLKSVQVCGKGKIELYIDCGLFASFVLNF